MKRMKKHTLAIAVTAISTGAFAELKLLDDSTMSQVTGKAGLTVDIEAKAHIGEFAYQDGGYMVMQNFGFGGSTSAEEVAFSGGHGFSDNRRMEVDVAHSGANTSDNRFDFGFSDLIDYATVHTAAGNTDAGMRLAAGITTGTAIDAMTGLEIDSKKTYGDGDLVIHYSITDVWQKGGGLEAYRTTGGDNGLGGSATLDTLSYEALHDLFRRAVDYNVYFEALGLASSDYEVGSRGLLDPSPETTVLMSNYSMNGYSGGWDFHMENNGNGYGADGSGHNGLAGSGNADSKVHWHGYFEATDVDYYIDIAGIQITDLKIHNKRGDRGSLNRNSDDTGYTSSHGMLHFKVDMYAINETIVNSDTQQIGTDTWVDGFAYDAHWKGDWDIGSISFGDTGMTIGAIYVTDMEVIYKHHLSAH